MDKSCHQFCAQKQNGLGLRVSSIWDDVNSEKRHSAKKAEATERKDVTHCAKMDARDLVKVPDSSARHAHCSTKDTHSIAKVAHSAAEVPDSAAKVADSAAEVRDSAAEVPNSAAKVAWPRLVMGDDKHLLGLPLAILGAEYGHSVFIEQK